MNLDALSIPFFFLGTIAIVLGSIELGYWLGSRAHRLADEKESPVSGVSGAILGLTAFMLAFTFGIVAERFDARKALVRADANAISTAYLPTETARMEYLFELYNEYTQPLLQVEGKKKRK